MGKLANISGKEVAKAFQKAGWQVSGQVWSHMVMVKAGIRAKLSITRAFNNRVRGFGPSRNPRVMPLIVEVAANSLEPAQGLFDPQRITREPS